MAEDQYHKWAMRKSTFIIKYHQVNSKCCLQNIKHLLSAISNMEIIVTVFILNMTQYGILRQECQWGIVYIRLASGCIHRAFSWFINWGVKNHSLWVAQCRGCWTVEWRRLAGQAFINISVLGLWCHVTWTVMSHDLGCGCHVIWIVMSCTQTVM